MNIITNFGNKRFEGSADELKKRIRQERKIYLVDWIDGYGEYQKKRFLSIRSSTRMIGV